MFFASPHQPVDSCQPPDVTSNRCATQCNSACVSYCHEPSHGGGGVVGMRNPSPDPLQTPRTTPMGSSSFCPHSGTHNNMTARRVLWEGHSCVCQNFMDFLFPCGE